ncbi:COP9 signalosome complex subunit 6 [Sodiomyces alkalinus F11]|uniref:COP9 signalosome complex subunit 6 n=1 Tax=Sodiomyces alkalinus (strain CBS 110278 / VKM F-3762 / F11) TaxID=1314773 RepID=A0A3N2Q1H6_SODAK|nr:COP9 signalosome complex subunit 6 [Sodiomyces alkalinus F11]ROT40613.1 COP9 signalosome complex subunit 6 [Sodiomyces alkalinus F11]
MSSTSASAASANLLVSSQASGLQAVLHPLVLLSISDYITRHTLREHEWPIVGGLMGQYNGREVSIEHAFECDLSAAPDRPYHYRLGLAGVTTRIAQLKMVHKDRNLDFVGWYTLLPTTGPTPELTAIHNDFLSNINESSILLGFHPSELLDHSVGGKLPLTIYESNCEVDDAFKTDNEGDKTMDDGESQLKLKFREIPYTVETGEAEMISMDFVASGSGNAALVEPPKAAKSAVKAPTKPQDKKGKQKAVLAPAESPADALHGADEQDAVVLSPEEEEMMGALTAKANATKMLHSRIQLIIRYLENLPPAFVSGEDPAAAATSPDQTTPSHRILRQIQALVGRLDLIEPSDVDAFRKEMLQEQNDVHLVSLLNDMVQSVHQVRDLGRKFEIVETAKIREQRSKAAQWEGSAMEGSGSKGPVQGIDIMM